MYSTHLFPAAHHHGVAHFLAAGNPPTFNHDDAGAVWRTRTISICARAFFVGAHDA